MNSSAQHSHAGHTSDERNSSRFPISPLAHSRAENIGFSSPPTRAEVKILGDKPSTLLVPLSPLFARIFVVGEE